MSDPAVSAAQRAWDETDGFGFDSSRDAMEESARAALAPIRADIERIRKIYWRDIEEHKTVRVVLDRIATHVYSSGELT